MSSSNVIGEISKKGDHEVEWTIKDFFSYTAEHKCYASPRFDVSSFEWHLRIYPNGEDTDNSGWIALYLYKNKKDTSACPVGADYIFGIKKEVYGTRAVERRGDESWVFEDCEGFGNSRILERSELLRRRSELAPSDVMTFTCTLRVIKDLCTSERMDTMSEKFTDMLINKRGCDVTLKVRQQEFHAHKFVLSARSTVFAAMFEAEMKEKHTGVVDIPDFHPETFGVFLQCLYSGKAEITSSNVFELYKIADKYDVEELKSDCRISIMGGLSVENVLDVVILGNQFDEVGLKIKSQDFFNKNFGKIFAAQKWQSFLETNSRLANDLLKDMATKMNWQNELLSVETTNW